MPHRIERRLQKAASHGVADHRDKMVELRQGGDEFLKGNVIMGVAHDGLNVATEYGCGSRELHRISADDDQRSPFRPSLPGNR
jgi:hypothetical protein